MKKLIFIIVLILWGIIGASENKANPYVSGYFNEGLSPYGSWIEIDYGVVVWRPTTMRVDWSPYRDGRWIWTTDGWYWQSYEPFGYITYHYGRWYFDDYYGWLWYPDYEWAPAWVEWRYDDDYIGWAPLHPYAVFSISVGIHFTQHYYTPYYYWNFVGYRHFYDPYVYNHCVAPRYKYRIYSNTRYRTNYTFHNGRVRNNGVDVNIVRKRTSHKIRQRDLMNVNDPSSLQRDRVNETGKIRTIYKSREELTRNEVRDVKYTRSDRKSTLDVTRLKRKDMKRKDVLTSNERNRNTQIRSTDKQKDSFNKKKRTKTNYERNNDRRRSGNNEIKKKKTDKLKDRNVHGKVYQKNETKDIKKRSTFNKKQDNRVKRNTNKKKLNVKTNRNNRKNVQTKSDIKKRVDKTFTKKNKKTTVNKRNNKKVNRNKVNTKNRNNNKKKNTRSRR